MNFYLCKLKENTTRYTESDIDDDILVFNRADDCFDHVKKIGLSIDSDERGRIENGESRWIDKRVFNEDSLTYRKYAVVAEEMHVTDDGETKGSLLEVIKIKHRNNIINKII